jgi:hypothetical protein
MIVLSRFRPAALVILSALVLGPSLLVGSCFTEGRTCNTIGCLSGLTIQLVGGTFDGGQPADSLDIEIANEVDQTFVPLMTCSLSLTGTRQLLCTSSRTHREDDSSTIYLSDTDLQRLRVTVTAGASQVSQETFTPMWDSQEIWGPGCGYCTRAMIQVQLPSS